MAENKFRILLKDHFDRRVSDDQTVIELAVISQALATQIAEIAELSRAIQEQERQQVYTTT